MLSCRACTWQLRYGRSCCRDGVGLQRRLQRSFSAATASSVLPSSHASFSSRHGLGVRYRSIASENTRIYGARSAVLSRQVRGSLGGGAVRFASVQVLERPEVATATTATATATTTASQTPLSSRRATGLKRRYRDDEPWAEKKEEEEEEEGEEDPSREIGAGPIAPKPVPYAKTSPNSWHDSTNSKAQRDRYIANTRRDINDPVTNMESTLDLQRARREARYLKDPLALANRVRSLLQGSKEPQPSMAYALTRVASKRQQCTVAWNHLIDYEMSKGKVKNALKAYNDMKKRAQEPDSYTYMLLLRGLAAHAHYAQTLGSALSIYHSMAAPNSRVPPTIKHTNVMLKVCARAEDMDALWGVAAKIPDEGPGAADQTTFTTILTAIRMKAILSMPHGLSINQSARRREKAIVEGRRIWDAIVAKWRAGAIMIDEQLACAMGRLLLIGSRPRDWDDVLSLVQQTMNIPRLIAKLGSSTRAQATHIPKLKAPHTPKDMREEDLTVNEAEEEAEAARDREGEVDLRARGEFDPLPTVLFSGSNDYQHTSPIGYAVPGNSTLSLIMEACLKTVARKTADDYWALLTDPNGYAIQPDADNLHMYMRVLRQARASSTAADVLRTYFTPGWDGNAKTPAKVAPLRKTFLIAMSTCVRDKFNPAVLANAKVGVELMESSFANIEPAVVASYLELVSHQTPEVMLEAVDRLGPSIINLKSFYNYTDRLKDRDRDSILASFKMLISIYDRLLKSGILTKPKMQELQERKSRCAAFVTRKANESARVKGRGGREKDKGGKKVRVEDE